MKSINRSSAVKWITTTLLLASICGAVFFNMNMLAGDRFMVSDGIMIGDAVPQAQSAMLIAPLVSGRG